MLYAARPLLFIFFFSREQAAINGEVVGEFDSYTGSTFNSFAIQGEKVETLTLTSVGLSDSEWISIIEVSVAYTADPRKQQPTWWMYSIMAVSIILHQIHFCHFF